MIYTWFMYDLYIFFIWWYRAVATTRFHCHNNACSTNQLIQSPHDDNSHLVHKLIFPDSSKWQFQCCSTNRLFQSPQNDNFPFLPQINVSRFVKMTILVFFLSRDCVSATAGPNVFTFLSGLENDQKTNSFFLRQKLQNSSLKLTQ